MSVLNSVLVGVTGVLRPSSVLVRCGALSMYRAYLKNHKMSTKSGSDKLKVLMFLGTCREGRLGLRVARFMKKYLEDEWNYDVTLFDPVEMKFPMLEKPVHFYGPARTGTPQWLLDAEKVVKESDAYIVVSAEYNHSIPPALSNMIDHFPGSAYIYKPSAIVCYSPGIYGGMRAAMQLRAMLGEIGCISVSNIFGIPKVHETIDENGVPLDKHIPQGANNLIKQLDWNARAMKNHRENFGLPK